MYWNLNFCSLKAGNSILSQGMFSNSSIYLIFLAALGHGVYSASKRNEPHKQKNNNVSGE
jgi:hypothetical protein